MKRYLQTVLMEIMLFVFLMEITLRIKVKENSLKITQKVTTLGGTLSCGTDYDITAKFQKVEQ